MIYHPQWFSALVRGTMLGHGLALKPKDSGGKGQGPKQISVAHSQVQPILANSRLGGSH